MFNSESNPKLNMFKQECEALDRPVSWSRCYRNRSEATPMMMRSPGVDFLR